MEICVPYVKKEGCFVALKGASYLEEVANSANAAAKLKVKLVDKNIYNLPLNMGERAILTYKKYDLTPNAYPRMYAKIKKNPL